MDHRIVNNATYLSTRCFLRIVSLGFLLVQFKIKQVKGEIYDEDCRRYIPDDYKKTRPPKSDSGGPVVVFTSLLIMDIDEINEGDMDFRLHTFITQSWNDSRLNRQVTSFNSFLDHCWNYLWLPSLSFDAAKRVFTDDKQSTYFHVRRDGSILLSIRHSMKVGCMMDFKLYPFDTQHCLFRINLIQTSDTKALLKWTDDESSPYRNELKAVRQTKNIRLLQFILEETTAHSLLYKYYTENFTYLIANFTFVRRVTGSIVNIYAPSALIVAVSWVTFWIRVDSAPARVSLSITSLLTLCTQVTQYKSQLPPVNYLTAMDIWLFACIVMVFSTLVEFAISYNNYSKMKYNLKNEIVLQKHDEKWANRSLPLTENTLAPPDNQAKDKRKSKDNSISPDMVCSLDKLCQKLYPASFTTFIVIYWIYFLSFS